MLHLLGKPPRLGEQVLRVEQHDVGGGIGAHGQVGEHRVLEARRDRDVLDPVGVECPTQYLDRVQQLDVFGGLQQAHPRMLPNSD